MSVPGPCITFNHESVLSLTKYAPVRNTGFSMFSYFSLLHQDTANQFLEVIFVERQVSSADEARVLERGEGLRTICHSVVV